MTAALTASSAASQPHRHAARSLTHATQRRRFGGIGWCDDDLALLYESEYKTRRSVAWMITPGQPDKVPEKLFDRNYEDVYGDPGSPMYRRHPTLPTSILAKVDGERRLLLVGAPPALPRM